MTNRLIDFHRDFASTWCVWFGSWHRGYCNNRDYSHCAGHLLLQEQRQKCKRGQVSACCHYLCNMPFMWQRHSNGFCISTVFLCVLEWMGSQYLNLCPCLTSCLRVSPRTTRLWLTVASTMPPHHRTQGKNPEWFVSKWASHSREMHYVQ